MSTVKVKLAGDCYVNGKLRKKDEVVSVTEEIADDFGEIVKEATPPVQTQSNQQTQGSQAK